jgi:DNA polymerase-1
MELQMKQNDFLLIIDGSSLLSTQFYGNLPKEILIAKTPEDREKYFGKIMKTSKGIYTNGIYGFLRTLFSIIEHQKPTHIAVTWDLTRDTFRREMYADYKANRSETMLPLKQQFELCQNILARMNIPQFMDVHYEADDFSGSIAKKFKDTMDVYILTKDHDYLQLVGDNVYLWLMMNDQSKADEFYKRHELDKSKFNSPDKSVFLDRELIKKEFGIYPESVPSLKGLMGDSADNIKGVPGIGDKTATALISYYETIDKLYDEIHSSNDVKALAAKWKTELGISRNPVNYLIKESDTDLVGEKAARLSEKLATIITDLDIEKSIDDLKMSLNRTVCTEVLNELEITSIKLPSGLETKKDDFFEDYNSLIVIDNLNLYIEYIDKVKEEYKNAEFSVGFDFEDGELVQYSIYNGKNIYCFKAEGFVMPAALIEDFTEILQNSKRVICFEFKQIANLTESDFDDCALMHYLLEPNISNHDSKAVLKYFNHIIDDDLGCPSAISAYTAFKECGELLDNLKFQNLISVYDEIDKPLVRVLREMENNGIRCSAEVLKDQGVELKRALDGYENEIYLLAGEKFNINSPKQLGEVLFDHLGIKGGKKTKTGYSTSADILEKLQDGNPIIKVVLNYRQLSKLISTYIEGLQKTIDRDGRIHCTFNQTVAATGRLSCTEPNLQNIPVREELGRQIRKAFVPKEGCVFVDADYSQIELRILAHMAGDEKLIADYKNSRDVHRATAASVFGVPYDEVTKEQRRNAKAVNFGIVYGISSFGLGQDLDIPRKLANEYINKYFEQYPAIKKYLDGLVAHAKKYEYVKTLYGRIRPIPEIHSSNFMQRNFGERIAMNSPIQGTASDIMKIAMIRVNEALKREGLEAKMLLQIHDEILIEAPMNEKDKVQELLIREMKNAAKLKVSLEVSSGVADNWYDLKQ